MIDSKLISAWPAALGRLYIGIAKAPTVPYTVSHLINGAPYGQIKARDLSNGRYIYQFNIYTSSADKTTVLNAINSISQSTFTILQVKYQSTYLEKDNLHKHIVDLTIRDKS